MHGAFYSAFLRRYYKNNVLSLCVYLPIYIYMHKYILQ